jgi:hypothetical protein
VELHIKAAGSLILSSLASLLSLVAILLAYVFRSDWAAVLWWAVLPELLVFTIAYLAIEIAKGATRTQAAFSLLTALPAFITGFWFFKNLHL